MNTVVAAVIRPEEAWAYRSSGISTFTVTRDADTKQALKKALESGCRFLLVTEELYPPLAEQLQDLSGQPWPAMTIVPGLGKNTGTGARRISEIVIRALGITMDSASMGQSKKKGL